MRKNETSPSFPLTHHHFLAVKEEGRNSAFHNDEEKEDKCRILYMFYFPGGPPMLRIGIGYEHTILKRAKEKSGKFSFSF